MRRSQRLFGVCLVVGASGTLSVGCLSDDSGDSVPTAEPVLLLADSVDLLFVVDNSISMHEKQQVLLPSAATLIADLVAPPCFETGGDDIVATPLPGAACPPGSYRKRAPVRDLHVGVISSSLGSLGGDTCDGGGGDQAQANDRAHLLKRDPMGGDVATYSDLGFLVWDPDGTRTPAGENDLPALTAKLGDILLGAGDRGCGYEMPLEAMTRFLSDPAPYQELVVEQGMATRQGTDVELLLQREAFLRPDSLVAVVLLSDENDCSTDPDAFGFVALSTRQLSKPTSACAINPDDVCCTSCALQTPAGCQPDPVCADPLYTASEDHPNLRCFDQQRRFGHEFRYPVERYLRALSEPLIDPSRADLADHGAGVHNPLFAGGRHPQMVHLTAIVGVPWQDLAEDPTDPDSRLLTSSELEARGRWEWMVGEEPTDPFMRESVLPRAGVHPGTAEPVAQVNGINGGDRQIGGGGDLQYACLFELATPVGAFCDGSGDDPACVGEMLTQGRVYPGSRQLDLVRRLGDRGIAGSICPTEDPGFVGPIVSEVRSFAYNRPMLSLRDRLRLFLR